MERQFNLHEISNLTTSKLKFYKEQRGFHSVQPSSETSENLNQDDIIRLEASLTNDSFDVFDSNLLMEGKLQKKLTTEAETAWVDIVSTTDDITLELNGILRMFKEMVIYSNTDKIIERVSYPGEVSTINQFLMRDYDFTNSDGQLNLFLPDTGKGDTKNSEYIKRKKYCWLKISIYVTIGFSIWVFHIC